MNILIFFFITMSTFAAFEPLNKEQLQDFLLKTKIFNSSKVEIRPHGNQGRFVLISLSSTFYIYKLDINNDGSLDDVLVYIGGGSSASSGIYKIFSNNKEINFATIVSTNLWKDSSGDLSKFHNNLAEPPFAQKNNKVIIRYVDPGPKFFEYLWEKNSFKLLK